MLYYTSPKKFALIVPYRNREEHLKMFVPHMSKYFYERKIPFQFYVIEQEEGKSFNKGKLLNIGFLETCLAYRYFLFHDVDMLPYGVDYSFEEDVTHLATKASQFNYQMPYSYYFGGVIMFTKETYTKINGAGNEYWGWGGEDDDLHERCLANNLQIKRKYEGKYECLKHPRNLIQTEYDANCERYQKILKGDEYWKKDGLNNCEYKILDKIEVQNLIHIKVSF